MSIQDIDKTKMIFHKLPLRIRPLDSTLKKYDPAIHQKT